MKKLFSLLLCVLGISSAMATPKTITIDNTNITFTSYSSNYASFSAENFSFMAKQCYKNGGVQYKAKATGEGGFNIYNETAIPNIHKIEIYISTDISNAGTFVMGLGDTQMKSSVKTGTTSTQSGTTLNFTPIDQSKSYFHINLTGTGKNACKFSKIIIYYEESNNKTAPPTFEGFSDGTGKYWDATNVKLNISDGASAYYTINGNTPTTESTLYTTNGIDVPSATAAGQTFTIKAIAIADGKEQSDVATLILTAVDPNAPITEYTLLKAIPESSFIGYIVNVTNKKVWNGTLSNKHGSSADVTFSSDGNIIASGVDDISPVEFIRNDNGKFTVKFGNEYLSAASSSADVVAADSPNYQTLSIAQNGDASIYLNSSRMFRFYVANNDFRSYTSSDGISVQIYAIVAPPEAPEAPQFSVAEANVAYNTGLTISSKNASKIIYSITYNNDEAENIVNAEATGNSMTLNIVRDCTISAKGCNSTSTTDAVGMSYTIVRPEAPTLSASGTYRQGSTISATAPEPCTIVYKVTNGETTVAEGTSQTNIWNYTLNSDCMVEVYSLLPNGYRSASSETADYTVSVDAPAKPVYTFNETEKSITFSAEGASTIKVKAYNIDGTVAEETSYPADAATVSGCNSMRARFEAVGLNSKDEPGEALDINVLSLLNRTEGNDVWTRVTSIDQITDGMVFAVVAHAYNMNGVDEKDYYMTNNVWGNSNKRTIKGSETTAITENHMSYENVPDDVARIKLEKRVSDGKWLLYLEKFYDGTNEKSGYLGQCDESNNGLSINDVTADKAAGYDVKMVERLTTSDGKTELELFPGALQFYSAETHPNFVFNSQNKVFGMYTNAAATVNNLPVYLYTRSLATQPGGDHYTANVSFAAEAQDLVRNEDQWFYQGWPENFEKGEVIVNVTGFDGATCVLHGEVPELPEENPAPTEAPRHRVSSDETHVHAYPQDNIRLLLDSNEKSLPIYADASRAENDRNLSVTFVPFSTSSLNFNGTTTALTTIGADSDDPVEYFNLQGLRIAYPQAGQILIRRQGDKVEKIRF